ncbi:hypothetical protein TGARI_372020 [Toxoplasma gondii ARI]|uniref:Uncharacterized protein n=1 Tax=Toxoplasma gondii ARI TaxID=1074872 RepID=A0A139XJJ8_TOXGO|nr:hypothetical protein TGARI_372020 [Toxoplasma gondii ARI]
MKSSHWRTTCKSTCGSRARPPSLYHTLTLLLHRTRMMPSVRRQSSKTPWRWTTEASSSWIAESLRLAVCLFSPLSPRISLPRSSSFFAYMGFSWGQSLAWPVQSFSIQERLAASATQSCQRMLSLLT